MTTLELERKWKKKIDVLLQTKDIIPEIDVKAFLKENFFELSIDLDLVLQTSDEKISLSSFVNDMIDYAIKSQPNIFGGRTGFPKTFPGLDYYDHRVDKYSTSKSVTHQAVFGVWRNDN